MRILIADDNQLIRRGVAGLLAHEEGCEICGEAADSKEVLEKASALRPDLILLDVNMPGGNGLETTRILKQDFPQIEILIITQHDPQQMLPRALEMGASGCIDKARLAIDVVTAIRAVRDSAN